jgi:hypothetical protein
MKNNGVAAGSSVDAGILLHEKILERLEYNFANIMSDGDFQPENIIQLFKQAVLGGSIEYPVVQDFTSSIERQTGSSISAERILSLLSAA